MKNLITAAATALLLGSSAAMAVGVDPQFDDFGALPAATFGGSGIPNTSVAIQTISDAGNTITLGLSATQRFFNPPLTNDGAGTFTAQPGSNTGGPGSTSASVGALWNFNTFVSVVDDDPAPGTGVNFKAYFVEFFYDFDPAADTSLSKMGRSFATIMPGVTAQDSQNLNFSFLTSPGPLKDPFDNPIPGTNLSPPLYSSFDPDALGEYSFLLRVSIQETFGGPLTNLGQVAINVSVVPLPAGALLLLSGLGAFGVMRRRKAVAT